tara:strand:+ start:193 stop:1239 length:1047 start_codon:yes stop_codon:yes gene_type:complete
MSILKVQKIRHTASDTDVIDIANDGTCRANITNNLSNRNLIINGAMQVAQRGTSFTSLGAAYTLDRFRYTENIDTGVVTVSQESITDLTGFSKALKINCTTAETGIPAKSGSKFAALNHHIEAQNLQQLGYGSSGAKTITLSFYVKSNITGTFCVSIYKPDQTARIISLGYTINSANTWERKTLTYVGDTGGGGIDDNNGQGLSLYWVVARQQGYAGTAATTWADNLDARFADPCTATIFENTNDHIMFTGVQLEVGSVATDFEHRSYADELRRSQRYFFYDGTQRYHYGSYSAEHYDFPVTMRVNPTVTLVDVPSGGSVNRARPNWVTITGMGSSTGNIRVKADAEL